MTMHSWASFIPSNSGGAPPATPFIRSSALLALTTSGWEVRAGELGVVTGEAVDVSNGWADDASNISALFIDASNDETEVIGTLQVSTDGGVTTTPTGGLPASGTGFDRGLLVAWRGDHFSIQVVEAPSGDGTIGGRYVSTDGVTWTRNGGVPRVFESTGELANALVMGATAGHVYFVIRNGPLGFGVTSGFSLFRDTTTGTKETQRLQFSGTVTGGTFQVQYGLITAPLAWDITPAAFQTAIQGILGPSATATGAFASGLDVTFGDFGPQGRLQITDNLIGGTMTVTETVPGTAGIYSYPDTGFSRIDSSFTNDVIMVLSGIGGVSQVDKFVNGAGPTNVVPAVFGPFELFNFLVSHDGTTWLGPYFSDSLGKMVILRTTNGGTSWAAIGITGMSVVPDITFDPLDPTIWYALVIHTDTIARVWQSTDSGASWSELSVVGPSIVVDNARLAPLGGRTH
ncbi:MAG: hypothetical protein ACKVVP_03325 [Chloroflexota bacterium]